MAKRFVITLTASNKVGILAAVSNALAELGGDLLEISQTVVHNYFTMIIAGDFPDERDAGVVLDHIRDVCRPFGTDVTLKEPGADELKIIADPTIDHYFLFMTGRNQPGMMRRVSAMLAQERIDIWNLHSVRTGSGNAFRFSMELAVPMDVDTEQLTADLESLGGGEPIYVELQGAEDSGIIEPTRAFMQDSKQ